MEQKKRYKKGFVLGKFLPPHKGHLYFIRKAMEQVDELTVLVCTVEREPIPGNLRYQWMKELLPEARVVHVRDEVPSYPHESPDFWTFWDVILEREAGSDTEVFFSSEAYGDEVAERMGIQHVLIDMERANIPVSGTAIRNNPQRYWEFIPDIVKPYFVKRIVLTGPESTGKTELAKLLAEHYKTAWAEELGRDYFVERNGKLVLDDMEQIANGQLQLEDQMAAKANAFLFCDTDAMVTQIWSEIYFKQCPQSIIQKSMRRKYALHILLDIDIPWTDDGTREFPHLREWHFNRIREELELRKVDYIVVSGDYAQRLKTCISEIDRRFL